MITIQTRFQLLREMSRFARATACPAPRHDFTDEPRERTRRLSTGWLECMHCQVRVPVVAAFFYEMGLRHGEGVRTPIPTGSSPRSAPAPGPRPPLPASRRT